MINEILGMAERTTNIHQAVIVIGHSQRSLLRLAQSVAGVVALRTGIPGETSHDCVAAAAPQVGFSPREYVENSGWSSNIF